MRGFSKAIITGNLTRDPELRNTPSGATVCSFAVAVNRVFKGQDGQNKEEVSYFDCTAWGRIAETIAQYAKKGSGVLVSGRLSQHSWEDKNGGGKRSRVEIVVEDFNFIGGRNDMDGGSSYGGGNSFGGASSSSASDAQPSAPLDVPDDIPEGEVDLSEVPF
ncbi:single-stranded DNA-binding protein [Candidatus Saccharibacteria bacterium]|nr:single-stranded DNA-binding protein [Candidatus Saccharibacteria bacterium]